MEILIILYMLLQLLGQSSNPDSSEPDVIVKKFSWRQHGQIESGKHENSNSRRRSPQQIYSEEMYNRNSIENRSRDMLDLEESVRKEARRSRYRAGYSYKVELLNTGSREVRAVFWAYTISSSSIREDSSQREFRCTVKIKPNSSKQMEGFSTLPLRQVVSAEGGSFTENVLINRVEYSGGDIWQRPAWRLPNTKATKDTRNQCESV